MIRRREFLGWVGAAPLFGAAGPVRSSISPPKNTVVVLDGIDANTNPLHLEILIKGFSTQGIPVTCIVDSYDADASRLRKKHPVSAILRSYWRSLPGLVQLCPLVRDLASKSAYFQARAIFESKQDLANILSDHGCSGGEFAIVACDEVKSPAPPSGVRTSGVRTVVVRPKESSPWTSETWDFGVVRLIGGTRLNLNRGFTSPLEGFVYLSMKNMSGLPAKQLSHLIASLHKGVRPQRSNGWVGPLLAGDLRYRDAYNYQRYLSLHFLIEKQSSISPLQLERFQRHLSSRGIPSSIGERSEVYWVQPNSPASPPQLSVSPTGNYEFALTLWNKETFGCSGLDENNILRLPAIIVEEENDLIRLKEGLSEAGDLTVAVSANLLTSPVHRRILEDVLKQPQQEGFTVLCPVAEQASKIAPEHPYITHHRRTASYKHVSTSQGQLALSRDQYLADARVAWSYFEKWTNPNTGLCPATISTTGGKSVGHEAVTMWDIGSHINALVAAHELEIINTKQFRKAIQKIFPNIKGRRSQGRLLPQGWIVTDRIKWGVKDFDGCDAGRLLAALYNLESYGVAKDLAAPLVSSWDLEDIVVDGIIHSVKDGEMISTYESHCAHYAAWAFRLWGVECLSPYETFRGRSAPDGEMALLETAGSIGPLGAEPLLLEALELGMSPESAYLADVLFAAQWEEHRKTGTLVCVSESPIDRPPWFVYSGLQLDARNRTWKTDTVESSPEHRSEKFAARNLTLSTKAAYLWDAYNPHEYSAILLNNLREKTKTKFGFRSGRYQASGEVIRNTDLNTNAIILQSIAHVLRDT